MSRRDSRTCFNASYVKRRLAAAGVEVPRGVEITVMERLSAAALSAVVVARIERRTWLTVQRPGSLGELVPPLDLLQLEAAALRQGERAWADAVIAWMQRALETANVK